jgi:hypothetical protein
MPYVKLETQKLHVIYIRSVSYGRFSYICVYITAFAICVMLLLYLTFRRRNFLLNFSTPCI